MGALVLPVLETRGLTKAFGGLKVFEGIDFALMPGERHAVIGPNGAGKSTFVNVITGFLAPTAGTILLGERDVTRATPQQRVSAGLARTFQINTLFPSLTPIQSVVLSICEREGLDRPSLGSFRARGPIVDEATALLARFGLADAADQVVQKLPYGEQRLLEVAMALALRPSVLLLDEPAAGLSTQQGRALFDQLLASTDGTTVLFIEHDMALVFGYADRVSVFAGGALIAQGTPEAIRADPKVREVYLGH